ncbi:MAG: hypothetical protein GY950_18240 [bacterium]|nr:hypothetical protein [bacterium]
MSDQGTVTVQTGQDGQTVQNAPGVSGTEQPKRRKPSKGFNTQIGEAELLAESMGANQERFAPNGGGEDYVNQLKAVIGEAKTINQDQEKYKADMKDATTQLKLKMKDVHRLVRKGRRIVKNEVEQERWVEFGIKAIW